MLAELLQEVCALTRRGDELEVRTDVLPDKVILRSREGVEFHDVPPPRRNHAVHSLAAFLAVLHDEAIAPAPEVWHDTLALRAFLDREDRRSKVTCTLHKTRRLLRLIDLAERPPSTPFTIAQAVRLLRVELHSTGAEAVATALRRVDFSRRSDGSVVVEHGRESLGKTVEAMVQQRESVPETFTLQVPVYQDEGLRSLVSPVACSLEFTHDPPGVRIVPYPDELEVAITSSQAALGGILAEALKGRAPVYFGSNS